MNLDLLGAPLPEPRTRRPRRAYTPPAPLPPQPEIVSWAKVGMSVRCIDVTVRPVEPGAVTSDIEKLWKDLLDLDAIYTIRELTVQRSFGSRLAIRLEEIVRPLEFIRRYRAKSVMAIDRPFLLTRFAPVRIANDDPVRVAEAIDHSQRRVA